MAVIWTLVNPLPIGTTVKINLIHHEHTFEATGRVILLPAEHGHGSGLCDRALYKIVWALVHKVNRPGLGIKPCWKTRHEDDGSKAHRKSRFSLVDRGGGQYPGRVSA
jgi:hypothetical protein